MKFKMANAAAGRTEVEQRKDRFAKNLQQLIEAAGLNLKRAAEEIGVPYPWVRRMVTAGTSRSDEKNQANLDRVAAYFVLPGIDHLWQEHLVVALLTSTEGEKFVGRFRDTLGKLYAEESAKLRSVDRARLEAVRKALRIMDMPPSRSTDIRTVVMTFLEDCQLPGLRPIAEKWLEGKMAGATPVRNGTDNGLCM